MQFTDTETDTDTELQDAKDSKEEESWEPIGPKEPPQSIRRLMEPRVFQIPEALEQKTTKVMLDLGFPMNLRGFLYMRDAVNLYIMSIRIPNLSTDIYTKISERYGSAATGIERSIRYVIDRAWRDNGKQIHRALFIYTKFNPNYHPTNSEMIATMAEMIRIGML